MPREIDVQATQVHNNKHQYNNKEQYTHTNGVSFFVVVEA
jgi:hypothetical protein